MTIRNLKLLTAGTALMAVAAGAASAATITDNRTTTTAIVASGGQVENVSGSTAISVNGSPAITISGTGAVDINISSSASVSSNAVTGTIAVLANHGLSALTINNSGTIANTSGSTAISATASLADGTYIPVTINNVGTISGAIVTTGTTTISSTGGTINGAITTSSASDTVTINGGSVTGAINLGAGDNVVTISNAAITGAITTTGGADTMSIQGNSTVTGNVDLGNAANSFTINSSTLVGNYLGGTGVDTVTLTNGIVSGTMNLGAGNNILNVSGTTSAFTTKGTVTFGAGTDLMVVNSGTTANISHTISGLETLNINSGSTVNVSSSFEMGSVAVSNIVNSGTLRIGAGVTVSSAQVSSTNGNLNFVVGSSSTAGQLIVNTMGASSYTITMGGASNFIASGTTFKIVDGSATATALTGNELTVTSTGVYRYSIARASTNQDISLTVGRIATADAVNSEAGDSIANALDTLGANASNTLASVQSLIGIQTNAAGVNNVVESLTPGTDTGVGVASIGVTQQTGSQISNRLASLRQGVATGDGMATSHMWVEGFGSTVEQDDKGGNRGFDASSVGATFGLDSDEWMSGYNTGLAFSYGNGSVDSNASNNAETDINSYVLTGYGSRVLDEGMFVNGQASMGFNQYDGKRTLAGGLGQANADYNGYQASLKGEVGKDIAMDAVTLTPLASLQYTHLNMEDYTETGTAGGALLHVDAKGMNTLDAGLGGQVAYTIPMEDGGSLKPSLKAKYVYRMGDQNVETTSNFTGGGASFNTQGVKADRSSVNLGAGLLLTTMSGIDLSADYNADIRSSLTGHTGQLKARWAF